LRVRGLICRYIGPAARGRLAAIKTTKKWKVIPMSPALERFESAVQILIGDGPVKLRLVRAYTEYLEDVLDPEVPLSAGGPLNELHDALHRVAPIGNETPVRASVQKMSSGEAAWHAGMILRLYVELLTQPRRVEPLKIVETAPPPQFLAGGG
jgi:hypothetical protein